MHDKYVEAISKLKDDTKTESHLYNNSTLFKQMNQT